MIAAGVCAFALGCAALGAGWRRLHARRRDDLEVQVRAWRLAARDLQRAKFPATRMQRPG